MRCHHIKKLIVDELDELINGNSEHVFEEVNEGENVSHEGILSKEN